MGDVDMKLEDENVRRFFICLLSIAIVLIVGVVIIPKAFAQPQSVSEIEIFSENTDYTKKEPGSWKVTKHAKWLSKNEAEISFDVDTILKSSLLDRDVLFVVDVSGSMAGDRIMRVKQDASDLVSNLLTNNKNKAGIITFSEGTEILSGFTDDKEELITKINSLSAVGGTSYYRGLMSVDNVLKDYTADKNRDLIVLLLTDGYPSVDTPNEVAQYNFLKDKYPFIKIKCIQYEMGNKILDDVANVSDEQYIADMETLNNVLLEASDFSDSYEKFEIDDLIDTNYFYVESEENIKTKFGKVIFDAKNNLIEWDLDGLSSGSKASITIRAKLKDEYADKGGFFSTNKEEIVSSTIGDDTENVKSNKTPVLSNKYKVIYDVNAPDGCTVSEAPNEQEAFIFDTVAISKTKPKCDYYQFLGWKIITKDVKMLNGDYFTMPEADVVIRAVWSKIGITKSMNGVINENITLYKQVMLDAKENRNAGEYTGDISTFNGKEKIYYYHGSGAKNNVIFENICWKIVRTTDTGGVKIIYNGVPDNTGRCQNNRDNHFGFDQEKSVSFSNIYYYGDNYKYDNTLKNFTLTGNVTKGSGGEDTTINPTGKYVCMENGTTCSTLYYVTSYTDYQTSLWNDSGYVIPLNYSTNYSQIGINKFNSNNRSLSDSGYMNNTEYIGKLKQMNPSDIRVLESYDLSTDYYFGTGIRYNKGQYMSEYELTGPYKIKSTAEYKNLVGKYFIHLVSPYKDSYNGFSGGYIVSVDDEKMYYINLKDGNLINSANISYTFYDSVVKNSSENYVLDSSKSSTIKASDWYNNYNKFLGKYYGDSSGNVYYVTNVFPNKFSVVNINELDYKYGSSFTYNKSSGEYTLGGEIQSFWNFKENYKNLSKTHYSCFNKTGKCKVLSYVYFARDSQSYYIELSNGYSVNDAIEQMLSSNDVNKNSSNVKNILDLWFSKKMISNINFLEDTVWCNDRSIDNRGGFNPLDGNILNSLYFKPAVISKNLSCSNLIDRFTVDKSNGNGSLTYPVGLITKDEYELTLDESGSSLNTDTSYWTLSPYYFDIDCTDVYRVGSNGEVGNYNVNSAGGIRPTVSLRPKIRFSDGDGSVDKPYLIDPESDN